MVLANPSETSVLAAGSTTPLFLLYKNAKTQTMKEQPSSLTVKVSNGIAVNVIPHTDHVFTMTTEQVAKGYGITAERRT
jgi:hypothetical protein